MGLTSVIPSRSSGASRSDCVPSPRFLSLIPDSRARYRGFRKSVANSGESRQLTIDLSGQVDQNDVRVLSRAVEHNVFPVGCDVESPQRASIAETRERA